MFSWSECLVIPYNLTQMRNFYHQQGRSIVSVYPQENVFSAPPHRLKGYRCCAPA
ncbi:hypothetical protein BDV96DRAFT_568515 [Lophiotrema nucula]|uniref:Uncharacterized protein n=1 Tax=Lophiotrema nucula TaxID=690887 RepID=A0A6A5ZH75_9PLEO|nr:hypothetical protein BDV96DRAFT_568515 [Lophiotrema nucula]